MCWSLNNAWPTMMETRCTTRGHGQYVDSSCSNIPYMLKASSRNSSWPCRGSSFIEKPPEAVFYLPMHSIRKESSTATKVQTVFDASAKISTGFSLNKTLLVGPMVHYSLNEIRLHRIPTADVSWMYRAIALVESNKDLHRFVWRTSLHDRVRDFCMTKHQAEVMHLIKFPLAAKAVDDASYIDDGVTGADSVVSSIASCRLSSRRPGSCYVNRTPMNPQCSNWSMWFSLYMSSLWFEYIKMLECVPRPLLSHSSKPSTSGRSDKESTSLGHCENFQRSRLVSPYYHPGQDTSAEPVEGEERSGGASCSSFCLVTFPDATTPRMSKSYPRSWRCITVGLLVWCTWGWLTNKEAFTLPW